MQPETMIPERFLLKRPIKGPTGASIVGYEWRSRIETVFHKGKQEYVETRVSDWESSGESTGTGREIVHLFYVSHPGGQLTVEGVNSAKKILGLSESRLKTIAKQEQLAQQFKKQQDNRESALIERAAKPSRAEASRDFRQRNFSHQRSWEDNEKLFSDSVLWEKNGKYFRTTHDKQLMLEHGWTVAQSLAVLTSPDSKS